MSGIGRRVGRGLGVLVLVLLAATAVLRTVGLYREPAAWWYPFVPALFSGHYTAGPFAMTSNTREDNPVWGEMPAFNLTLARLAYAARRGEPSAQVAWLQPRAGWKDQPTFPFRGPEPNAIESPLSRALVDAGLEYDRVSRAALGQAGAGDGVLQVGQARYEALLVDGLDVADPALLGAIARVADAGVPVLWLGGFPQRASGWADHARRDAAVREQVAGLRGRVRVVDGPSDLRAAFAAANVQPVLAPADGGPSGLRWHRRRAGGEQWMLLFNGGDALLAARHRLREACGAATLRDPATGEGVALPISGEGERLLDIAIPARRTQVLHLSGCPESESGLAVGAESAWDEAAWRDPPATYRPFIRWWWPGAAVETAELLSELRSLHAAGFGGVELQTLTLGFRHRDLAAQEARIYRVGTPEWLAEVRAVMEEAERLGMTVELTLGSGWSSGGPFIDRHPSRQLLQAVQDLEGPLQAELALPAPAEPAWVAQTNRVIPGTIGAFDADARLEHLLLARIDPGTEPPTLSGITDLTASVREGRVPLSLPAGRHRLIAVWQNRSAHNAAGSAYPGALRAAPILDHLDPGGVQEYIEELGEPWLAALAPQRPAALFVDSFELIGDLPWSARFAETFRQMHGYDVGPWLPLAFRANGESKYTEAFVPDAPAYRFADGAAERIREDYEAARERLFLASFVRPLAEWAQGRGTALKLQAHGGYGDYLDGYSLAAIPESEMLFAGGSFDFLKLASSAAHVAGRPVASAESFINLALDFDALDIEGYHLLAGNAFAAGINRTVCHGYAYHYPLAR